MNYEIYAITTTDNPYDPIDDFKHWMQYDTEKGYYTCSKLGRLANLEQGMSQKEMNQEFEAAIDKLIRISPIKLYKKIVRNKQESTVEEENSDTDTENNIK